MWGLPLVYPGEDRSFRFKGEAPLSPRSPVRERRGTDLKVIRTLKDAQASKSAWRRCGITRRAQTHHTPPAAAVQGLQATELDPSRD